MRVQIAKKKIKERFYTMDDPLFAERPKETAAARFYAQKKQFSILPLLLKERDAILFKFLKTKSHYREQKTAE